MRVRFTGNIEALEGLIEAYINFAVEILKKETGTPSIHGPQQGSSCLYIRNRADEIIAFIIFYRTTDACFFISASWVAPDYRRKGLYNKLWNALVNRAAREDINSIDSYVSPKNTAMKKAAVKRGSEISMSLMTFAVPKK